MWRCAKRARVWVCVAAMFCPAPCGLASDAIPRITTHDNTRPGGVLKDGVFTIHLTVTEGEWYPEAEDGAHIAVYAFAEEARAPSVPGPLIRVPEGTEIHASVRNTLQVPVAVHGFYQRGGKDEPVVLAAGEQREFNFAAGAPGTYYYWAGEPGATMDRTKERSAQYSQLSGPFIVDEQGSQPSDRVFVIGLWKRWEDPEHLQGLQEFGTINGKSWPYTERLAYRTGEQVRWRWINATGALHPMHMHGSFYEILSRGDGERDQPLKPELRPLVVTDLMQPGSTMTTLWQPEEPGHWLFHCHLMGHLEPKRSLSAIQGKKAREIHGHSGMVGLVMALDVSGPPVIKRAAYRDARKLTLLIEEKRADPLQVKLSLVDGVRRAESHHLEGPPIVLRRGEPAEITVVNHLSEPTSIHWHGMELESYYDGVPHFTGMGKRRTPLIPPGGKFTARMTPPRAGTFIYHTHWDDIAQLQSGLHGPLLVTEDGKYQPEVDKIFVAAGLSGARNQVIVNGSKTPAALEGKAGKSYHVRLINIGPNIPVRFTLFSGTQKLTWRAVGKDGMTLPAAQQTVGEATQLAAVGETYDFEVEITKPGDLAMRAFVRAVPGIAEEQTIEVPIRVR